MPLTGTSAALQTLLNSQINTALTKTGATPDPKLIDALAEGISIAVNSYLLSNLQIGFPIPVGTPAGPGGTTAPGTPI